MPSCRCWHSSSTQFRQEQMQRHTAAQGGEGAGGDTPPG